MASLSALETNIATGSTLPNGERPVLAVAQDPASPPAPIATTNVPIANLLLINVLLTYPGSSHRHGSILNRLVTWKSPGTPLA